MQLTVLNAKTGDLSGRLVIERIHLPGRVKLLVAARKHDPVDRGDFGRAPGRRTFSACRVPIICQNAVGRIGGDKNPLAARHGDAAPASGAPEAVLTKMPRDIFFKAIHLQIEHTEVDHLDGEMQAHHCPSIFPRRTTIEAGGST